MAIVESINYLGKPYEGKPHVRFDKGSRETTHEWELRPCPTLQDEFNQGRHCRLLVFYDKQNVKITCNI